MSARFYMHIFRIKTSGNVYDLIANILEGIISR